MLFAFSNQLDNLLVARGTINKDVEDHVSEGTFDFLSKCARAGRPSQRLAQLEV